MTASPFDHLAAMAIRTADRHGPVYPPAKPSPWRYRANPWWRPWVMCSLTIAIALSALLWAARSL
jgi:hypothetical protein